MDLLITEKSLRKFLDTPANIETIANALSESGPTVDRLHKLTDDNLLEIEVITNRIDCASVFGIAREANAILTQRKIDSKLKSDPYNEPIISSHQPYKINIKLENPEDVRQFLAICIDNVHVKSSDIESQNLLNSVKQRPINNLVDITNIYTLLYGIPSHIFDKDKLDMSQLSLRNARDNEKITLLDNTSLKLKSEDLIIEDGSGRIVDLCGVMGGQIAEVDNHTKNLLLIIPFCNPKKIRKTSLYHQKRTLASQIFEKSPDVSLSPHVFSLLVKQIIKSTGGHVSSQLTNIQNTNISKKTVELDHRWLEKFSGSVIKKDQVTKILHNLGFECIPKDNNSFSVEIPSFRFDDINTKEDLAEEIIRIFGYKNITEVFPPLKHPPVLTDDIFSLEKNIRQILSTLGYSEVINSSLISKNQIENCNLEIASHAYLKNYLSEDLKYLRTSLVPSALQNHTNNQGKGFTPIRFFEIANIYTQKNNQIVEVPHLIISSNENMLSLKSDFQKLFNFLHFAEIINFSTKEKLEKYLDPKQAISIVANKTLIGTIGQILPKIQDAFNIDKTVSIIEINLNLLSNLNPSVNYKPLSQYPDIIEDINIDSLKDLGDIYQAIRNSSSLVYKVKYIESYKNKHTFRIHFRSYNKNITQQDTAKIKSIIQQSF